MLRGVLRHVLATAGPIELASHARADLERRIDEVHDRAVVGLSGIGDSDTAERAAIAELATGLGIERSFVEDDRQAIFEGRRRDDGRFEAAEIRIGVIEAASHRETIVMI